jgi:hypothetical protein
MFADRELGEESGTSFELRKWYLDCVDADGNAAIAYWAKLRWRYINLYYRTVAINGVERRCTEVSWRQSVSMEASAPPIRRRLFEGADGIVDWSCEMPRAKARIGSVRGDGYAELLRMTVPPWKLPIDELRWGRFIGGGKWAVWIEWRGALPQKWAFGDAGDVRFDDERVLTDRRIGDAVPLIKWLLPRRIRRAREQKWCSRASLGDDRGWAIHEVVTLSGSEGSPPPRSFAVSAAQDDGGAG